MIGIIILIFAVGIYISGNKKWSTLIYLGMLNNGFQVLTDRVIGIKNLDIAFIYMVIICIYSQIYEKPPKVEYGIKKHVYWLFAFMVCSVLFSYIHYGFTFAQILQGSRHLWFFMSYLFLRKLRYKDVIWIFEKLYYITLIVSVLYIIQVIFRLPTLPYYDLEYVKIESATGLSRFYNFPFFLDFFIIVSVLCPKLIRNFRWRKIATFIFIIAILCTQGRTYIGVTAAVICLGLLMKGQASTIVRFLLIAGILLLPFSDLIIGRFEGRKGRETDSDITAILNGDFIKVAKTGKRSNLGTLTYRFAWVYERAEYLSHRPLGENVFGLGLISDSQTDAVHKMYHFKMGIIYLGKISQMSTPDIAYGNLLSQYGYLGGILLLSFWIRLLIIFCRNRKIHPLFYSTFLALIVIIFNSVSDVGISYTSRLGFYFCIASITPYMIHKIKRRNETNSIQTITI